MSLPLEIYILTFNCGRALIDPNLLGSHFFQAWPKDKAILPDVIAVSLQEVAPITYAFFGGSWLAPYLQRVEEAVRAAAKTRQDAAAEYETLMVRNLGMTALMLFVKKEVRHKIKWIQTAGCGVGVWEMGNKGAVGVRLGLDSRELTFVAMHLAPMEGAVLRRNEDWKNIARDLVFENVPHSAMPPKAIRTGEDEPLLAEPNDTTADGHGIYKPGNFIFLAGDLNYRTSLLPPTLLSPKTYPQPANHASSPSSARERLSMDTLWTRDQLSQEIAAGRTLHGFTETPVKFPPTYKYDNEEVVIPNPTVDPRDPDAHTTTLAEGMDGAVVKQPERWTWAKHRWPSWCDRILFLPSKGTVAHLYDALPLFPSSDHRAVALSITIPAGLTEAIEEEDLRENPPFNLSTDWKARRAAARWLELAVAIGSYLVLTKEGNAILAGLVGGGIGGYFLVRVLV